MSERTFSDEELERWANTRADDAGRLARALIETRRERDLAIAHDRQDYPTVDAYELVCAARTKHQERADSLKSKLDKIADIIRGPHGDHTFCVVALTKIAGIINEGSQP